MSLLIAAGSVAITLVLSGLSLFSLLELRGLDLLFALRGTLSPPAQIVVVAIDEPSFAQIDTQWPWPRSLHAQLLRQLGKAGAKVVGFDVLFAEPSNPDDDRELAAALREAGNAVLVSELSVVNDPLFRHTLRIDPIPMLRDAAVVGIPMISVDADGVVRRTRIFAENMPSFAYQLARAYLATAPEPMREPPFPGIPVGDSLREMLIDHRGPPRTVQTVSYYQALQFETLLPPGIFEDKIVLVGRSVEAIPEPWHVSGDTFLTPFSWIAETPTAGVEIQATVVSNLLEGRFIHELGQPARVFLLLTLMLPTSLLLARLKPLTALAATIVLAVALVFLAWVLFAQWRLWIPIFAMLMALFLTYGGQLLARTIRAERERLRALETLNRGLEAKVAERTQALSLVNAELSERHQQLETTYLDLALAKEHLIQSEKMASLGLLVAGVAHELNNPISYVHSNLDFIDEYTLRLAEIIRAYSDTEHSTREGRRRGDGQMRSACFDETFQTLQELIKSCQDGAERIKKIVLDLRTFSRSDDTGFIEAGLLEGLESSLNLLAKQYQDRVTIHRAYDSLPKVECLPGQINQVFMNVLQNAVQAIPDRGEVWVSAASAEDRVSIAIRDNGVGIAEEHLAKLFDPFFTTKPVGTGTGLGLSISYRIVERHGGTLRVSSQVGKGTEFVIDLPLRATRTPQ